MSEDADEVKVFRSEENVDVDDTTNEIAEDKKDVVLEAELESKPSFVPFNPGLNGTSSLPRPAPVSALAGMPGMGPMGALSPSYMFAAQMMMMNQMGAMPMSPSFGMGMWPQPMSPVAMHQMMMQGPGSPMFTMMGMAANAVAANAALRNLSQNGSSMPGVNRSDCNPLTPRSSHHNPLSQMNQPGGYGSDSHELARERQRRKENHIKKPLNAFMWFMKENRPKMLQEEGYKDKQSAELNKVMGELWQKLSTEERKKYFDMAKEGTERHKQMYPGWSASQNYHRRHHKRRKDKDSNVVQPKRCRAQFGESQRSLWCLACQRKKKCIHAREEQNASGRGSASGSGISSSSGPSPHPTHGGSGPHSPSESDADLDEDDEVMDDDNDTLTLHQAHMEHEMETNVYL